MVNVQWLTDILLGNFTAMNQMDNQAYQTYSNPPNLSFDPKIVPNLMRKSFFTVFATNSYYGS